MIEPRFDSECTFAGNESFNTSMADNLDILQVSQGPMNYIEAAKIKPQAEKTKTEYVQIDSK